MINQHFIGLKLDSVSVNKSIAPEFVIVKVSNVWNKTLENKSIAKDNQIPNKWTNYKIFELKHGNTKLLGNTNINR